MPSRTPDSDLSRLSSMVRHNPQFALWLARAATGLRHYQQTRDQVEGQLAGLGIVSRDVEGPRRNFPA